MPKTYQCCGIVFNRKNNFSRHVDTKHGDKRYFCPKCNVSTKRKDSLKCHLTHVHKMSDEGAFELIKTIRPTSMDAEIQSTDRGRGDKDQAHKRQKRSHHSPTPVDRRIAESPEPVESEGKRRRIAKEFVSRTNTTEPTRNEESEFVRVPSPPTTLAASRSDQALDLSKRTETQTAKDLLFLRLKKTVDSAENLVENADLCAGCNWLGSAQIAHDCLTMEKYDLYWGSLKSATKTMGQLDKGAIIQAYITDLTHFNMSIKSAGQNLLKTEPLRMLCESNAFRDQLVKFYKKDTEKLYSMLELKFPGL